MKTNKMTNRTRERANPAPLPTLGVLATSMLLVAAAIFALHLLPSAARAEKLHQKGESRFRPSDMVLIPGGAFIMGDDGSYPDELPLHKVEMSPFYIDAHEVTNAQFAKFVEATGYVTQAEKDGHCWAYFKGEKNWEYAAGTDWRHPQGPTSNIKNRMNDPVVCVSWYDATAYAKWAGKRLPTEAEWEYAARAGSPGQFVANAGGNEPSHSHQMAGTQTLAAADRAPSGKSNSAEAHHAVSKEQPRDTKIEANIWEGHWPEYNEMTDGFYYTAPVESFAPNAWGVYDMLGNVWEWTADWYDSTYFAVSPTTDPQGPAAGNKRVARGGSWFCSPNYCGAYSTHYRGASPPDHAFNNVGFRCAIDLTGGKR